MARFDAAIAFVLRWEGGYSNDKSDPGGETYRGVSRRSHPDWLGWQRIDTAKARLEFPQRLDEDGALQEQVVTLYRETYWLPVYDQIGSQAVATKLLDIAVNMGHAVAHRMIQQACNEFDEGCPITIDGSFGPETLQTVNSAPEDELVRKLAVFQAERYARLVLRNPKFKKFLKGWMARAQDVPVSQPAMTRGLVA